MSPRTLEWLSDFQARFGSMLRTPLDRTTGTLRAMPASYDAEICREARSGPSLPGPERLAVYNRQYWFRLFGLLASAFPLTSRLFGHWRFNDHAARFFVAHPPSHWNIDRAPDGFEAFLKTTLSEPTVSVGARGTTIERAAVLEAARIDEAWRTVFFAPPSPPYRPSPADAARLPHSRLRPSPAAALVEEHWPLLDLRNALAQDSGEDAVALPSRWPLSRWWALVRRPAGIGQLALSPREAELFRLLREHTVSEALGRLEAACSDEERASLPEKTREWLTRSVELDFWSGLDDG